DEAKLNSTREIKRGLTLALHISKLGTFEKQAKHNFETIEGRVREIAGSNGNVERLLDQTTADFERLRPGNHEVAADRVDARLEAPQPSLLYEVHAELPKAESVPVIAEESAKNHAS